MHGNIKYGHIITSEGSAGLCFVEKWTFNRPIIYVKRLSTMLLCFSYSEKVAFDFCYCMYCTLYPLGGKVLLFLVRLP